MSLTERIVGWQQSHRRLHHGIERVIGHERFERMRDEPMPSALQYFFQQRTWYEAVSDVIACNVSSLPFIFNDKYGSQGLNALTGGRFGDGRERSWSEALMNRATALVGNTLTGPQYKRYSDAVVGRAEKYVADHPEFGAVRRALVDYASKVCSFATGQSLLYALYYSGASWLKGEQPTLDEVAGATISLTVLAPIAGPWFDWVYQSARVQLGLAPVSAYRRAQQERLVASTH